MNSKVIDKIYIIIFLILVSCSNNYKVENYCLNDDFFTLAEISGNISRLEKKIISSNLINNSSIKFEKNNNKKINLDINFYKKASITSNNNTTSVENINFTINYKIYDKDKLLTYGKFIISDEITISKDRFSNYITEEYLNNNFAKDVSFKLKNRIDLFLKNNIYCSL